MASISLTTVVNEALRFLGILDSGGSATPNQLADALATVNNLIRSKSADRLMAAAATVTVVATGSGTQSYSIGNGQTWNLALPVEIVAASFKLANGFTFPLKVVNAVEWTKIPDRDRQSYLVKFLFYTRGSNLTGTCYLSPIPLGGNVELITWTAMGLFSDTTAAITVQDSYVRWLELATALELAPQYPSAQVTPGMLQDYSDATATLRNHNASLFGMEPPSSQVASNATPPSPIQPVTSEAV